MNLPGHLVTLISKGHIWCYLVTLVLVEVKKLRNCCSDSYDGSEQHGHIGHNWSQAVTDCHINHQLCLLTHSDVLMSLFLLF